MFIHKKEEFMNFYKLCNKLKDKLIYDIDFVTKMLIYDYYI